MNKEHNTEETKITFEQAFQRLEAILEILNTQHPSLDDSLKLYEEADKLIIFCSKKLNQAEKKIEVLVKNREGVLQVGVDQKPITQDMQPM